MSWNPHQWQAGGDYPHLPQPPFSGQQAGSQQPVHSAPPPSARAADPTTIGIDPKAAAGLGYLFGVLALIWCVSEKQNRFVRFHAIQSLLFVAAIMGAFLVLFLLGISFGLFQTVFFAYLSALPLFALAVGLLVMAILAFQGKYFRLPVLGAVAEQYANKGMRYTDPTQPPQNPSGQLPYGQQPSGQPPSGQPLHGPPAPNYVPLPQQPQKRRRGLWIAGIVGVLLLACGVVNLVVYLVTDLAITNSPATGTVNNYYSAITSQNYSTAYTFLDTSGITLNNQPLTQSIYVQTAQALDVQRGPVMKYSITSTSIGSNAGVNTAAFTVNVTRGNQSYDVHLQLKQEGNAWKIVNIDGI